MIGGTKTGHARGPEPPVSPTPARLPAWELPANLLTGCGDACQVPASRGEVTARWFRRCKIGIIYLELLITYKLALSICVGACDWLHASQIRSGWRSLSLPLSKPCRGWDLSADRDRTHPPLVNAHSLHVSSGQRALRRETNDSVLVKYQKKRFAFI